VRYLTCVRAAGIDDPGYNQSQTTSHQSLEGTAPQGLGCGVGRSLGIGMPRGVGVGRTVAVGVAEGVGVAVGLGVGVGVPPPPWPGAWISTVIGDPVLKKPTVALAVSGG
jgi:hypothetical protein